MSPNTAPRKKRRSRRSRSSLLFLGLISLGLVVLTLRVPTPVHSSDGLDAVRFGYPFWFVEQDLSHLDPPSFPVSVRMGAPFAFPTEFSRPRMTAAYLCALFLVAGLFAGIKALKRRLHTE